MHADCHDAKTGLPDVSPRQRTIAETLDAVGHTMGAPLQTMTNALFVVRRNASGGDEGAARMLDRLEAETEGLKGELEELLSLPRVLRRTEPTTCTLGSVCERTLPALQRTAPRLQAHVRDATVELEVEIDTLTGVLQRLVANATELSADDAPVELEAGSEQGWLELRVVGGDPGHWPPVPEHAIDPLYTTKPRSFGLGLAVADGFAAARGGNLSISVSGERSAVTLRLPLIPSKP